MLRTAIREYVIQPMAVQMRPARATAPVQPKQARARSSRSLEVLGRDDAVVADEARGVGVEEGDEGVEGRVVAVSQMPADRERDVDGGEDREERLVAHARREDEAVAREEVPPDPHGEQGHGLLRERR